MSFTRIRTIAGTSLLASAIALGVFGAVGTASAAPVTPKTYGAYTCYDYATQTFYQCFDPN